MVSIATVRWRIRSAKVKFGAGKGKGHEGEKRGVKGTEKIGRGRGGSGKVQGVVQKGTAVRCAAPVRRGAQGTRRAGGHHTVEHAE